MTLYNPVINNYSGATMIHMYVGVLGVKYLGWKISVTNPKKALRKLLEP